MAPATRGRLLRGVPPPKNENGAARHHAHHPDIPPPPSDRRQPEAGFDPERPAPPPGPAHRRPRGALPAPAPWVRLGHLGQLLVREDRTLQSQQSPQSTLKVAGLEGHITRHNSSDLGSRWCENGAGLSGSGAPGNSRAVLGAYP